MKTDGLFTTASFTIPFKRNQEIHLAIWGDVHRDSPNHAESAWDGFLTRANALRNAIFLGMGDYLDSTSSSERACLNAAADSMHETFLNDLLKLQQAKVKLLAKELKFMRGRLVGLLGGNHFFRFPDQTTTDQRLCQELGCNYLGVSSFVRLVFSESGRQFPLDIWAHHGAGASRLPGGSINRVDQMREHAEADIYVMGHDHKKMAVPAMPRLYLDRGFQGTGLRVKQRQQWLVRSGSFLASYEPGVKNYNVDAARGPCSLGHVELIIIPKAAENNSVQFEIHPYY